jgi:hypothetical protein
MPDPHKIVLTNERGNEITISAEAGPLPDEVTLVMIGPHSETTNIVTVQEALALGRVIQSLMGAKTCNSP